MASINAQTARSTNASECSAALCQSESRSSEKTASPVAIEAKSFEFAYPPSEDPQAPRASIGPLDWRVPQGGVPAACRRDRQRQNHAFAQLQTLDCPAWRMCG